MTLIIPRKEAPVSGEGTVVIPQPAGDEPVIKNTFFFPISTRSASGNVCALSRPSPPPVCVRPSSQAWRRRMRSCTSTANRKLLPVLRVWRTSRRTTSTVKASKFFYYERAVCAMATASLYERYRGVDASAKGDKKADSIDSTIDELWRDMRWAVARIRDKPRCIVSQI